MISLLHVSKSFEDVKAVDDVTLDIADENHVAIIGPSGSGKTTLLRLIAGLEIPDNGEIYIDRMLASNSKWTLEPHRRKLGFVFQTPALWPHMTVAQNILFGLHNMGKEEVIPDIRLNTHSSQCARAGYETVHDHDHAPCRPSQA